MEDKGRGDNETSADTSEDYLNNVQEQGMSLRKQVGFYCVAIYLS
jgi:hypothetical protein